MKDPAAGSTLRAPREWARPGVRTGTRERLLLPLRSLLIAVANQVIARLPGHALRRAYYRHVLGWRIGRESSIHQGLVVYGGRGRVSIGERSTVQIGCMFLGAGMEDLTIGNDVAIAYRVTILLGSHDIRARDFHMILAPVRIEDHVFIGANAIILAGVTLGQGCVVGAGAVVGKDVPPYAIVAGNPAKVVGERPRDLDYSAAHEWWFH